MKLGKRKATGREKDEAALELLEQVREKLYSDDASACRRAAFNLSWLQEDGLEILKEALFGDSPRTTKSAAAYGLRSMRGRMKKMAAAVFEEGLKNPDRTTRDLCKKALLMMASKGAKKTPAPAPGKPRFEIKAIPNKTGKRPGVRDRKRKNTTWRRNRRPQ